MKIGTLSLNINTNDLNYGAVLHSWAFQRVLKKQFNMVHTEIIDYVPNHFKELNLKYPIVSYIKGLHPRATIKTLPNAYFHAQRYEKFREFVNNNMIISTNKYDMESLNNEKLDYDCVICESDVIWSPSATGGKFDPSFFMALDSMKDKRKIAYSASLANAEFSDIQEKEFISLIKNVDFISVREKYAAQYVNRLSNKEVTHVLDPTMLLKAEDYEDIIDKRLINEKYLLIYFPLQFMPKLVQQAKEYAKAKGLKVIEISSYPLEKFRHKTFTAAGIGEFLSLIKNAEVIFTNSFHGVCFSVLFEKDFYAYSRKTGKKIEDFCKLLKLSNRYISNFEFKEQAPINYDRVNKTLNVERSNSLRWLEEAINVKEY